MPSIDLSATSALSEREGAVSSRSSLCQAGIRTVVVVPSRPRTVTTWCVGQIAGGRITMWRTCACSATITTST